MMISLKEYFGEFGESKELTDELRANATKTVAKASELLSRAQFKTTITSGFRPSSYNKYVGGSSTSKHMYCQAADLWDPDKEFGMWCLHNVEALKELGCAMEALCYWKPDGTKCGTHASDDKQKRWVHIQTVIPPSGHIVFIP